jgi:hypothetical protein
VSTSEPVLSTTISYTPLSSPDSNTSWPSFISGALSDIGVTVPVSVVSMGESPDVGNDRDVIEPMIETLHQDLLTSADTPQKSGPTSDDMKPFPATGGGQSELSKAAVLIEKPSVEQDGSSLGLGLGLGIGGACGIGIVVALTCYICRRCRRCGQPAKISPRSEGTYSPNMSRAMAKMARHRPYQHRDYLDKMERGRNTVSNGHGPSFPVNRPRVSNLGATTGYAPRGRARAHDGQRSVETRNSLRSAEALSAALRCVELEGGGSAAKYGAGAGSGRPPARGSVRQGPSASQRSGPASAGGQGRRQKPSGDGARSGRRSDRRG